MRTHDSHMHEAFLAVHSRSARRCHPLLKLSRYSYNTSGDPSLASVNYSSAARTCALAARTKIFADLR